MNNHVLFLAVSVHGSANQACKKRLTGPVKACGRRFAGRMFCKTRQVQGTATPSHDKSRDRNMTARRAMGSGEEARHANESCGLSGSATRSRFSPQRCVAMARRTVPKAGTSSREDDRGEDR